MIQDTINNIKSLGIDMIHEAGSGHPGIVLGAASILYTLYAGHMNISTNDSNWVNRDRFVLSSGHGSSLLYAVLYMAGYGLTIDDLKQFRRVGSKTPGHPEVGVTPGVDMSTGPLGQGFASAVGMALGEKILHEKFKFPRISKLERVRSLIDYNVYVLCGDGDLMEGITNEAASLAGTWNLDNLIVLYDSNNVTLDGDTSNTFTENVLDHYKALGWHTDIVRNGSDVEEIDKAITKAKNSNRPSLIEIKTIIGQGSYLEGRSDAHGKVLSQEDLKQLKQKLGVPFEPFYVNENAYRDFREKITARSNTKYLEWSKNYKEYIDTVLGGNSSQLAYLFRPSSFDIGHLHFNFQEEMRESTRVINGDILNSLAHELPNFIGGSADVATSTQTYLRNEGDVKDSKYNGRNIWFGVREHAMGAILNGLALTNFRVFGSTFLAFSDYLKPAIRLSSLMKLPVTYIFSHDSIAIGQDGPTHQPIEQLAMLRSIPNLNVFRPCDAHELLGCWQVMLASTTTPGALILSKQAAETLPTTDAVETEKGAYIVRKEHQLHGILVATGNEVQTAYHIACDLKDMTGLDLRVVSMPCQEIFLSQSKDYQEGILPKGVRVIVIEAATSFGWHRFVYNDKYIISVDSFGVSGTKDEVLRAKGFDYNSIKERIVQLLK